MRFSTHFLCTRRVVAMLFGVHTLFAVLAPGAVAQTFEATADIRHHNLQPMQVNMPEMVRAAKLRNYHQVVQGLVPLVNQYLGGTPIQASKIEVRQVAIKLPAMLQGNPERKGHSILTINHEMYLNAVQHGVYTREEMPQAVIITLFHELVHAWQAKNRFRKLSHAQLEGHATFAQTIFSMDYGLDAINQKGFAAFQSSRTIQSFTGANLLLAWGLKTFFSKRYLPGFRQMQAEYNRIPLEESCRLEKASHHFREKAL
ncbi:MAG: hypothetical protein OXT67_13435 [Zetaproteobacteria bacterium]|nr:hypothetical protein [Zetaproteobacteria bacterium]